MTKNISKVSIIVPECYNIENCKTLGLSMAQPGIQGVEYPDNLFNTWLEYRLSSGIKQSDLIREINQLLKRKYDNHIFYQWKKQIKSVPDKFNESIIYPVMPEILEYLLTKNGVDCSTIDLELFGNFISNPRSTDILERIFQLVCSKPVDLDFQLLADAIKPAVKIEE